jgi:hypothetical protein
MFIPDVVKHPVYFQTPTKNRFAENQILYTRATILFRIISHKSKFYPRGNKMQAKAGNSCYYAVQTRLSSRHFEN